MAGNSKLIVFDVHDFDLHPADENEPVRSNKYSRVVLWGDYCHLKDELVRMQDSRDWWKRRWMWERSHKTLD